MRRASATHLFAGLPTSVLAAATAWFALLSWRGLAQQPSLFLNPLLLAGALVALCGWVVRRTTARSWLAVPVQLVVLVVWLLHHVSGDWLPSLGAVRLLARQLDIGVVVGQKYTSPVSTVHPEFHLLLLVGGLGVLLAVDLLCCGLRRAALAGLPLLLTITISASLLLQPVSWLVFLATAFGWLGLLAMQETARVGSWGRGTAGASNLAAVGGLSTRIAVCCALVAVVLTGTLSSAGRDFGGIGQGDRGGSIQVVNPLLDLRRNLTETRNVAMVSVATSGAAPSYLRLTVLDEFTGSAWQPSERDLAGTDPIAGTLPPPPGVEAAAVGPDHVWRVKVASTFASRWLPLPYPATALDVGENWRYDPDTFDVVGVGDTTAAGMSYAVSTFTPRVDPVSARTARPAPASLRAKMTDLPNGLPTVFQATAQQVTRNARNDFDRAVLLQNWFRSGGGFTYSTKPAGGSGIATLVRFVTSDRVGYCVQFSAAMAVMARTLHIPARVAVGFLSGEPSQGRYVFGSHDLHSWPELYFDGVGWIRFEPTPSARTGGSPAYAVAPAPNDAAQTAGTSAGPTAQPSQFKPKVAPANGSLGPKAQQHDSSTWWFFLLGVLVLAALLLGPRLLRISTARRRWATAHTTQAVADAAWSEVRATAMDLELGWSDASTVRTNGRAVHRAVVATPEALDAITEVVTFVELTRYARPQEITRDYRNLLRQDVRSWQHAMFDAVGTSRARRARWYPRSVLETVRRSVSRRSGSGVAQ
ncbi:MAG: DUF3488 and transglutaminase-like domain-containing protein [Mycobacteriaceae bacterium]